MAATRTLPLYRVTADAETGAWHDDLECIGDVDRAQWAKQEDTSICHFDVFSVNDELCAVEVHFAFED